MPPTAFSRSLRRTVGLANSAVVRVRGRALDAEPLVRLLGMRPFARRFYGVLVDGHGVSFADVDATLGRIRSLRQEVWAREWSRTAQHYDRLGRGALQEGRTATACELLVLASTYYRFAEMGLLHDGTERLSLERAAIDTYLLAGRYMKPPLERVSIPVDHLESIGYLRVPATEQKPPVVLIIPGLGMTKEHGDFPQEPLLSRGMAALTIDLPAQGENRGHFKLNQDDALRLVGRAIDYIHSRDDLDSQRLALLGTSMGAAAALLTACHDRRVKALVEIAGFYNPTAWWERFPTNIKEFLRYVVEAQDYDELYDLVRTVSLNGHVRSIECPLLVVHGGEDAIIPPGESELIFAEATAPKRRFIFPRGDHGCVNVREAHPLIADWLAEQLGTLEGANSSGLAHPRATNSPGSIQRD